MEYSVHSVVFHVGPNSSDTNCKSDIALGFVQGKLLLIREEFHAVLSDDGSAA